MSAILRMKKADLTAYAIEHMSRVINYVKRNRAEGTNSNAEHSRWRYSLMNWVNDPLKR
ncbi:DUF3140 domain-containing protein [Cryobacterium melibiosiphilum]|uniref:DUF3140 domain-containing protein n=2 Tax=Cryobacterium melibiosiphilum TaxID=995039 RepID=A0A3A5MT66_9MICO|nr:DUF3140 domain-containing protein [Cryobacterium melibiosiphilum]